MGLFGGLTAAAWATVVLAAWVVRNRLFATFVGVLGGIYSLSALGLAGAFAKLPYGLVVFGAFHVTAYLNFLGLVRPRMRGLAYRVLVSWPAAFMIGGTLLGMPWAVLRGLGFEPWGPWIPYALAGVGLLQSLTTKRREVDVSLDGMRVETVRPHPHGGAREERPLRIVQISDPHLGPFMSVKRLRRIAERAVAAKPDLVLLTGDFLTMESQSDPDLLLNALEPLRALPGRVFACNGNHDHEAPAIVKRAMAENGIPLLVDESVVVDTEAGPVQILGMDFVWRDREEHMREVCARHPRVTGATRVILLHDPGAFKHLPEGEGDLVLSGHTHGGQVGLVSLGLSWTFLRLFGIRIPDHGFWARGTDRMYVHSGTGHYGFPLRLGVPAEETVLRVHRSAAV
ncbi:MAG: metallophosphoesterase [Labilithrix sp.]|nr:metallophosphoesterase [Labilithrix sp.]MCW5809389.1 metallophosphoesterase [Labilithrix sp.]